MKMKCYFSSMLNKLFATSKIGVILAFFTLSSHADEAAEKLLSGARYSATLQNQDLQGRMKKDGKENPVALFLRGQNIQFQYKVGNVDKRFHMHLMENQFDLFEMIDGKKQKFDNAKLSAKINDTDLSFEDLSMRFLYWKDCTIVGEEKVSGQMCHKVRLVNPDKSGDYRIVNIWVHQKYGALMSVVGYDLKGSPLKRFQVTDLMKVGKNYTLKRMRVDSVLGSKVTGTTYLEFDKPKIAAGAQPGR